MEQNRREFLTGAAAVGKTLSLIHNVCTLLLGRGL